MPAISLHDRDIGFRSPKSAGKLQAEDIKVTGLAGFFLLSRGVREAEQLWTKAGDLRKKSDLLGCRICILGFDHNQGPDLGDIFRDCGIVALGDYADIGALDHIDPMSNGISHVLVNIDAFSDLDTAVSDLLSFRLRAPSTSVILVSSAVSGDDFGSERRPIADATLRWPLTGARLGRAMRAAI